MVAARFVAFFATEPVEAATFAVPLAMTFMTADWRAARRAAMFLPIFLAVSAILPKTLLAGVCFAALLVAVGFFAVFFLATFDPSMRPGVRNWQQLRLFVAERATSPPSAEQFADRFAAAVDHVARSALQIEILNVSRHVEVPEQSRCQIAGGHRAIEDRAAVAFG